MRSNKIVHIVLDEKFIDMGLRQFEDEIPGQNIVLLISEFGPHKLKFIKNTNVSFVGRSTALEHANSAGTAAIVFHSLCEQFIPILKNIRSDKKIFWLGWGFDYYSRLLAEEFPQGLLLPRTRVLIDKNLSFVIERAKRRLISYIKNIVGVSSKFSISAVNKIDYFCPVFDVEYELIKKHHPQFLPKYLNWNYAIVERDLSNAIDRSGRELGDDILIGNSASPENNHLEVFDLLKRCGNISGKKIVVPLTYGYKKYRDIVIAKGREYFGDSFFPVIDHLPQSEFVKLLDLCGFVFMNHLRQQGTASIGISLLKGAKIFMNPVNPAYMSFKKMGAEINQIQEIVQASGSAWLPLTIEQKNRNVEVMYTNWGEAAQKLKTKRLVTLALGEKEDKLGRFQ